MQRLRISISMALLILSQWVGAQENTFQQQVSYDLDVTLNDEEHLLSTEFKITYTNNSPQALTHLVFHLWANAYSDKESDFAKQLNKYGDRSFYFAPEEDMGGYMDIQFESEGETLSYDNWQGKKDVIKLMLPNILESGESVIITGNYQLKIPVSFSRMGRSDSSYQISQWYPKPAVFDQDGWHPMPYLQLGEYYSEFANYSVHLHCPAKYVVAATGELHTQKERETLLEMAKNGTPYPEASGMKSLHYSAQEVHDFAFFMDQRWLTEREQVTINDRTVEAWSFYTPSNQEDWQGSAFKVARALQFMSRHVGSYPYPQSTAVDGVLSVGGGMEYPMITLIGEVSSPKMLDQVIAHEVTHNWFYGVLATNERIYPWLDEGPTSYYESRYMKEFYQDSTSRGFLPTNHSGYTETQLGYFLETRRAFDMPSDLSSTEYDELAYGVSAYAKPQLALSLLEAYYSKEKLDAAFAAYFDDHGFTHPGPSDLKSALENSLGDDLSWWFDQVIGSRGVTDYCIHKVKQSDDQAQVRIKNKGDIPAPIILQRPDGQVNRIKGVRRDTTLVLDEVKQEGRWEIDPERLTLDAYDHNNVYDQSRIFPNLDPLQIKFAPGVPARDKTYLYMYPISAWNQYDHWMAGVHISNVGLIPGKWGLQLTPLWSFAESELSGMGRVTYNFLRRKSSLRNIQVGVEAKKFNYDDVRDSDESMAYTKVSPFVTFKWMGNRSKQDHHDLHVKVERLRQEMPSYAPDGGFEEANWENLDRAIMAYQFGRHGALHPFHITSDLEYGNYNLGYVGPQQEYLRWTAMGEIDLYYKQYAKVKLRGFVGAFIVNDARNRNNINDALARRSLGLAYQGYTDFFEESFFGRTEQTGFLSRQVALREGGFKTAFTSPQRSNIGSSNDWIASANMVLDLPMEGIVWGLFKPFVDVGYYSPQQVGGSTEEENGFIWSSGISLHLMSGALQFHLPLVNSSRINEQLDLVGQDNIWKRITFTFSMKPNQFYHFLENTRLNF